MSSVPGVEDAELLDVVDATGEHLGVAPREVVHRDGSWHQVFHCLIVRRPGNVVLQRRALSKAAFPNQLDLSATGHLHAGEAPLEGVRELNEELGIDADATDLVPLGVRLLADDSGEGRNRERVHAFLLPDDRPLHHFRPPADEVSGLVEVNANDLLRLLAGAVEQVEARESRHGSSPQPTTVACADLVNPTDGYWTVVLVMAERYARGEQPLAV